MPKNYPEINYANAEITKNSETKLSCSEYNYTINSAIRYFCTEPTLNSFIQACIDKNYDLIEQLSAIIDPKKAKNILLIGFEQAMDTQDIRMAKLIVGKVNVNETVQIIDRPFIHTAIAGANNDLLKLLLEHGANPNIGDPYNINVPTLCMVVSLASKNNNEDKYIAIAKTLLKNKVNKIDIDAITQKVGGTALMIAAQEGCSKLTNLLIEHDADIEVKNNYGLNALTVACTKGKKEIVETLLKSNANINHVANNGGTSLIFAAQEGHAEIVAILLRAGAKTELAAIEENITALIVASQNGHIAATTLLARQVQDLDELNTALAYATKNGHDSIKEILEDRIAIIEEQNASQSTAAALDEIVGADETSQDHHFEEKGLLGDGSEIDGSIEE